MINCVCNKNNPYVLCLLNYFYCFLAFSRCDTLMVPLVAPVSRCLWVWSRAMHVISSFPWACLTARVLEPVPTSQTANEEFAQAVTTWTNQGNVFWFAWQCRSGQKLPFLYCSNFSFFLMTTYLETLSLQNCWYFQEAVLLALNESALSW